MRKKPGPRPKPRRQVRRHRVVVLLNDAELARFKRLAERRRLPLGTVAYQLVMDGVEGEKP